jgi:AraC-like DNA-binding protein
LRTYSRESIFEDRRNGSRSAFILSAHPIGPIACDSWKIAYVTAGSAVFTVDGIGERQIRQGDVIVLRRGCVYSVVPITPVAATVIYIDSAFVRSRLGWVAESPEWLEAVRSMWRDGGPAWILCPTEEHHWCVSRVFSALANNEGPAGGAGGVATSIHAVARLLDLLDLVRALLIEQKAHPSASGIGPAPSVPPALRHEVAQAAKLLFDCLDQTWTVDRLAAHVHLSSARLSSVFKDELGCPPMTYLNELRLQRFAYLLAASGLAVSSAAASSGWRNPEYAGRMFKRRFGVTPTEYRSIWSERGAHPGSRS